jgi:hypothetical protein
MALATVSSLPAFSTLSRRTQPEETGATGRKVLVRSAERSMSEAPAATGRKVLAVRAVVRSMSEEAAAVPWPEDERSGRRPIHSHE